MPVLNSVNQTIDWIAMNDSQIQSLLNAICFQNLKCRKMTNFTGITVNQHVLFQCILILVMANCNSTNNETIFHKVYLR